MATRDKPPAFDDGDMGLDLDDEEDGPPVKETQAKAKPTAAPSQTKLTTPAAKPSKIVTPAPVKSAAKVPSPRVVKPAAAKPTASKPASQTNTLRQPTKSVTSSPPIIPKSSYDESFEEDDDEMPARAGGLSDSLQKEIIEQLEQLNQSLIMQLEEKDKQFAMMIQESNIDNVDELSDSAAKAKVVSLAKKNKSLSVALEKEKTKNARLLAEVLHQQPFKSSPPPAASKQPAKQLQPSPSSAAIGSVDEKEIQELRDAHSKTVRQLSDAKDKLLANQKEITNLRRVLQRELGDNVDINKVLDDNTSNWKGRAQQIAILKAKIGELSGEKTKGATQLDDVHREGIYELAEGRRQEFEKITKENTSIKEEHEKLKLKLEAKESRIKILETKSHDLQEKMKVVLDKTKDDDQLIALLKKELTKVKAKAGM